MRIVPIVLFASNIILLPCAVAQEQIIIGKRIVGGEPTDIKKHPWQVALNVKIAGKTYLCGGSIIGQRWVLTAAHCFEGSAKFDDAGVKAGVNDYGAEGSWIAIEKVIIHPGYDDGTHANDIALLKLGAEPKGEIIPLLDAGAELRPGDPLEVTGWGVTETGEPSQVLRKANVPYVDNATCNKPNSYNGNVLPSMMCAGFREGGSDACQGDSGGPLVWNSPDGPLLAGVVSTGEGCALRLKYGIYTRVTSFRDWISSTILASNN